jgi:hypothetical protein
VARIETLIGIALDNGERMGATVGERFFFGTLL